VQDPRVLHPFPFSVGSRCAVREHERASRRPSMRSPRFGATSIAQCPLIHAGRRSLQGSQMERHRGRTSRRALSVSSPAVQLLRPVRRRDGRQSGAPEGHRGPLSCPPDGQRASRGFRQADRCSQRTLRLCRFAARSAVHRNPGQGRAGQRHLEEQTRSSSGSTSAVHPWRPSSRCLDSPVSTAPTTYSGLYDAESTG
jgi:hypothetical protein